MSEVDTRAPTRGRSSARGGRGGYGRGGPRGGRKQLNGTSHEEPTVEDSLDDQGELGEMKKKYASELGMLKDMFPDWTDVDLVFALEETSGDITATVDHITQGSVSQFAEVKKPKDRARSKVPGELPTSSADKSAFAARGGRGRGGFESSRGRGGRGGERGRGGFRGARGGHATTNGAPKDAAAVSVPTSESSAWDTPKAATETGATAGTSAWDDTPADTTTNTESTGQSAWGNVVTADATPAAASEGAKSSLIPDGGAKKSWASMFAQKPAPAPIPKPVPQAQPPPAELIAMGAVPAAQEQPVEQAPQEPEGVPEPAAEELAPAGETQLETPVAEVESKAETPTSVTAGLEANLAPSHVPLTEENVEHLPDASNPPATFTAASTTGSVDPRNLTPLPGQQPPIGRPALGGFALSAHRAAGAPRTASYQRRVQEQQESVVMPGHNAVDRAAVQFGSMGLNGDAGMDVDDEREDPETRQAPQHSPPSLPKTALPPAPRQSAPAQESGLPEALPTPKQATPSLPSAPQQVSQQAPQQAQEAPLSQPLPQESTQATQNYNQYGAYGQQQDQSVQHQKQYDPFGHQAQQSQYERYGAQPQQQSHSGFGGLSSAPGDFSSYYTSEPQRSAYPGWYNGSAGYGPQETRGQSQQQEAGLGQQRSTSGFGVGPNESSYGSQSQQAQRYADTPGSGQNTPHPPMGGSQQTAPGTQQSQHQMQQQSAPQGASHQQSAYAGFPYGHPYYNSPYQTAYANQFGYSGGQQQQQPQQSMYGGGYPSKQQQQQSMYGQPQGYGSSYDQHSASPANASAYGQNHQQSSMRSASGMGSGLVGSSLDEYGRQSAQAGSHSQNSGFGGMNDPFARTASGFGGQSGYGQQQGTTGASTEDSLKPFNDSKTGPSPALGQPNRPGSAANSAGGSTGQAGLQQQQQQSAFGQGYAGFPGQGSQYGGLGGLGSQQQQHGQSNMGGQGGYGGYGAGGFGQYGQGYGGGASRGGWGQSYQGH